VHVIVVEAWDNAPSSRVDEPGAVATEAHDLSIAANCDDLFAACREGLGFGLAALQRRHLGIVNEQVRRRFRLLCS
jgi:hypothetical protein